MAYNDKKDIYSGKREWAARRMAENSKIKTLTEKQHEVLDWLCNIRHEVHTNQDDFFAATSHNYRLFWDYIENASGESEINRELSNVNLPQISFCIDIMDYRNDMDYDDEVWDEEMSYNDAYEEVIKMAEKFNNKIESYLLEIDKKHGTNYCPSGIQRLN